MNRSFAIACGAAALGIAASTPFPALAQDDTPVTVTVSEKEPFGRYLTDGEGMSLYMLEADTQGAGAAEAISACSGECLEEWPALITSGEPEAGDEVDASMLSTIEREDGSMQVTYNGWPLYYYHDDQEPGDTEGQDVHDQWGEWYLIAPSGEPIEEEGEGS